MSFLPRSEWISRVVLPLTALLVMSTFASNLEAYQRFRRGQYRQPRSNQYRAQTPSRSQATGTKTSAYWTNSFEFGKRNHDFGAVPTASKQEYIFEFKNTLDTPIQLVGVRASCGCTKPTILTPTVNPGEMARVKAKYDTVSFRGAKSATVTLSVRRSAPQSQSGEIQFSVRGKIRQDVVLNPGLINFANVSPGKEHLRTVQVKYAGNPQWKVVSAKSSNPNLTIESREISRDGRGRVGYELVVKLSGDQTIGMFTDEITLVTTDRNGQEMKLAVEGRVKAIIESSAVNLGVVNQDTKINKRLILRGSEAFEIEEILVDDKRIVMDKPEGLKSLHIINYSLDTSSAGAVETEIKIVTTAVGQRETIIPFKAKIVLPSNVVGK